MTWQDIVLSVAQVIFAGALLPSVFGKDKPALTTSLVTGLLLIVLVFTFYTLELWFSAGSTAFLSAVWLVLAVQKFSGKEKSMR